MSAYLCAIFKATVTAQTNPNTHDEGVIINGIKWTTHNVDAPGTFAAKPEDPGMFYQWNRKVGWSATDSLKNSNGGTAWDSSEPAGDTWEKSNDPCPVGWRVLSLDEISKLSDKDNVTSEWITVNGVNGRRFTDKATGNSLFLPAAGYRYLSDGTLKSVGSYGDYWSGTQGDSAYWSCTEDASDYAYHLYFGSHHADWNNVYRSYGFSVRSVAE